MTMRRRRLYLGAVVTMSLGAASCPKSGSGSSGAPLGVDTSGKASLTLTSVDFAAGGAIPKAFTCEGDGKSPSISWSGAPLATKSFALIVDDPDAPSGTFTHWVLFDVPSSTTSLAQGASGVGVAGRNDFEADGYGGPCPPPGKPHRYFFRLYALDLASLGPKAGAARSDVEAAMKDHVVASGELFGTYGR